MTNGRIDRRTDRGKILVPPPTPRLVTEHKKGHRLWYLLMPPQKTRFKRAPTTIKHYVVIYDSKDFFSNIFIFMRQGGFHTSCVFEHKY